MKKFLMLIAAAMVAGAARAAAEIVDGIEWSYWVSSGEASVGDGWKQPAVPCSTMGEISIPPMLGGCPVTSIDWYAFYGCSGLTSVTIPSSVTKIGWRAFGGCSGLVQVVVDENNPIFKSVNGLLLTKDGKELVLGVNGSVTIPEGVTSIGDMAFYGCSGLTSVTIPSSVTNIGDCAFDGCNLSKVIISGSNFFWREGFGLYDVKNKCPNDYGHCREHYGSGGRSDDN